MPRFVILEHDFPILHWDLMLEWGSTLRTWRLSRPPAVDLIVDAEASFDHRPIYLDYEGPISGNRGCVRRWEWGTFSWVAESRETAALTFDLVGQRLKGMGRLVERAGRWQFSLT